MNWLGSDYCLNLYLKPVVTDKFGSLYRFIGVGNVERARVNNYLNGSARQSSNILQRNREDFAVIFQSPITDDKNSSFRDMQSVFSGIGGTLSSFGSNLRGFGLNSSLIGLLSRSNCQVVGIPSLSFELRDLGAILMDHLIHLCTRFNSRITNLLELEIPDTGQGNREDSYEASRKNRVPSSTICGTLMFNFDSTLMQLTFYIADDPSPPTGTRFR